MDAAARSLRSAFGRFATGIAVVTTRAPDGAPVGLTVNSITSVSLAPPLLGWALMQCSGSLPAFRAARRFAVHVLGAEQRRLAERFARRGEDRFRDLDWAPGADGLPLLPCCLARFACRTERVEATGDHLQFLGRVEQCEQRDGAPLLYFASRYALLAAEPAIAEATA